MALGAGHGQDVFHGLQEILGQVFLGHITGGAALKRLDGDVFTPLACHEDDGQGRVAHAHFLDEVKTIHLGHLQIGEHQVGGRLLNQRQRLSAVGREANRDACLLLGRGQAAPLAKKRGRQVPIHCRIVHNKNRGHGCNPPRDRGLPKKRCLELSGAQNSSID